MQWTRLLPPLLVTCLGGEGEAIDHHGQAQAEWLRSRGGYFNPKIEFRRLDESNPKSPMGLFASEDILENEKLVIIPQNCLITSGGSEDKCDTTNNLIKELKLKDESDFAPYVNYLLDSGGGHLPSSWSDAGKRLIETILGKELPPYDVTGLSFEERCDGTGDAFEETAYLWVVSRGWEHLMVPLFDLFNHRNGRWTNVDNSPAYEGEDITVFASRDVVAGEQLHNSYNECSDCGDVAHSYTMQNMLMDYGFVEQYPQRWAFEMWGCDLVFELDEVQPDACLSNASACIDKPELTFSWLEAEPTTFQVKYLRGHLKRLRELGEMVYAEASRLVSNHERNTIIEFYEATMTALGHATFAADADLGTVEEECEISATGEANCVSDSSGKYDGLDSMHDDIEQKRLEKCQNRCSEMHSSNEDDDEEKGNEDDDKEKENCYNCCRQYYEKFSMVCDLTSTGGSEEIHSSYDHIDEVQSHYTRVEIYQSEEKRDMCLFLNDWLHTCASFRPHYHEVIVHYPAQFIDEVKRVLFIGGGDLFLLEEILKYPSLELVIGLELDQQVGRTVFQHFGAQPHWDNEKVQWWFGDAAVSLQLLPKEYYGTFDLVIVDLRTEVLHILMVGEDLRIMDAAVLLLSPKGIIIRNEDFVLPGETQIDYTDFTAYINYNDVPVICHQTITMGSNNVDFLSRTPIDHKIDSIFFGGIEDHLGIWYNYQKDRSRPNKRCNLLGSTEIQFVGTDRSLGAIMIIEAEDAELLVDSPTLLPSAMNEILKSTGLTQISVQRSHEEDTSERETVVYIIEEGYIAVRPWPKHRYCAFDVLLWKSIEKQDVLKAKLVAAVGSKADKSSSSYRIVTGGMFGIVGFEEDRKNIGPQVTEECQTQVDASRVVPTEQSVINAIVGDSISLIKDSDLSVAVLCGEQSRPCSSVEALANEEMKVVPVWTCPDITASMVACESDVLRKLKTSVEKGTKISGIVIDTMAPRAIGQILHKILSKPGNRKELLADSYVVLAAILDPTESWRNVLLEKFRVNFAKFAPAHRAEVTFNSTVSSLGLGIFSSGDVSFYSNLVGVLGKIEEKTYLVSEVRRVRDGILNYLADFEPSSVPSLDSYDMKPFREQWYSQHPLGHQTFFQFKIRSPESKEDDEKNDLPELSMVQLQSALEKSLQEVNIDSTTKAGVDSVGDGCVISIFWYGGTAILVWDGRAHVNVNLFTDTESMGIRNTFEGAFLNTISFLELTARDEYPRGFGRVVNFQVEIDGAEKAKAAPDEVIHQEL